MTYKTNRKEYDIKKNWTLDQKIEHTKNRILQFYEHNNGKVYLAFSGGKDSTVLKHIIDNMELSIKKVFSNTTNEHFEIINFVKTFGKDIIWTSPEKSFKQIIKEIGVPIISKKVSMMINTINNPTGKNEATINLYSTGIKQDGSKGSAHLILPKKYKYLLDIKFPATQECCDILKKKPMHEYEKQSSERPIVATLAEESLMRMQSYFQTGCINYNQNVAKPMSIWTEDDVWEYINKYNVEICDIYYDKEIYLQDNIIEYLKIMNNKRNCIIFDINDNKIIIKGEHRTGCSFCGFGVHLEKGMNRFDKIALRTPKKYISMMTTRIINDLTLFEVFNDIVGLKLINPYIFKKLLDNEKYYFKEDNLF